MALIFGSEYSITGGTVRDNGSVASEFLDSTHAIIAWKKDSNGYGTCVISTISGNEVSYGTVYTFSAAATNFITIINIDSTHAIIVFSDDSAGATGKAVLATISGTDISFGTIYSSSDVCYNLSSHKLSSDSFIMAYTDYGNTRSCMIGTLSGTTISFGSAYNFDTTSIDTVSVTVLSDTKIVVAYNKSSTSGACKVGTISSGSISFGNEYIFDYVDIESNLVMDTIDSTNFIIAYNQNKTIIGTINNTAISYGTAVSFLGTTNTQYLSIKNIDTSNTLIAYNYATSNTGKITWLKHSGNVISIDSSAQYNSGTSQRSCMALLTTSKFIIGYNDYSNSQLCSSSIGNIPSSFIPQILFL